MKEDKLNIKDIVSHSKKSPRNFRKKAPSINEDEGRIFFMEVSNETKWLLEPCGAFVKSVSRVNSYQKTIYPGTKEDLMVDWDQGYVKGIAMWDIKDTVYRMAVVYQIKVSRAFK